MRMYFNNNKRLFVFKLKEAYTLHILWITDTVLQYMTILEKGQDYIALLYYNTLRQLQGLLNEFFTWKSFIK